MDQNRILNVAIVGGGPGCKAIMDMIFTKKLSQLRMRLVGVADRHSSAVGYRYAQEKGIFTTGDYRDLFHLEGLNLIVELTGSEELANEIARTKPDHIRMMDHVAARLFWDVFQIEEDKLAEREQAQEAIRESETKYSTLVESSLTGIYIDQDGIIVFANQRFADIFGYERQALMGMNSRDLVHPEDRSLTDMLRGKRLKGEAAPSEYEARGLTKDGRTIWIARRNTRIEYEGRSAILGNVVDITLRRQAEEELRESEQRSNIILESIQTGIIIIDPKTHTIVDVNPAARKMIGATKEEIVGRKCHQFMCPAEKHKCPVTDLKMEIDNSERSLLTADGVSISILKTVVPVFLSGRKHLLESFLDISERKRAEEELRESQERYYTVLEACPDPVVVYDMKGQGVYINPAFTQVFGWTPGEILGMKLRYVPEESWPETKTMIDKVLAGESFTAVESKRSTKEGNILDVSISAATFLSREGKPAGSVHILRDITEQKMVEEALKNAHDELEHRVEERTAELGKTTKKLAKELVERKRTAKALQKSEEKLRRINTALDQGLSDVFEALEQIASGNPRVRIPEKSELRLIKKLKHIVNLTAAELEEIVDLSHEFAISLAEHFDVLHRVSKGDMVARISSDSGVELLEYLKRVTNAMIASVTKELVERKDAEEALRIAHKDLAQKATALEAANEELSQYAYVVSHDLKAPLRAIRNYSDFLREDLKGQLEEEQEIYLDGLNRAVLQGDELVGDLLEFSRVGRRRGPIETIDMGVFFRELVTSLDLSKDVELAMENHLPSIEADQALIRQIFQNLIRNAVKFNRSEHKRLEIGCSDPGEGLIEMFVRDNGIGIDERYHNQIFRVFQRLHTREEYDGTGLGLAIVKKAVNKLRGSVRVESELGKGSTFFVSLPKIQRER
jgi:PAS domain S-box-containing protein